MRQPGTRLEHCRGQSVSIETPMLTQQCISKCAINPLIVLAYCHSGDYLHLLFAIMMGKFMLRRGTSIVMMRQVLSQLKG